MKGSSEESALDRVISVNRLARRILEKLLSSPDLYGIKVEETAAGTTIIDAGIKAKGGFEAGRLITEICMGGCAKAEITSRSYGDLELPTILVYSDNPLIASLGSQYAGWQINEEGYSAICSGPARALASKPKKIFDEIAPQLNEREGGYTRVLKLGIRKGDGAQLSIVELLIEKPPKEEKKGKKEKGSKKEKPEKEETKKTKSKPKAKEEKTKSKEEKPKEKEAEIEEEEETEEKEE